MTVHDNVYRHKLAELIELNRWLDENKKREPRSVVYAAHRYCDSVKSTIAKFAAEHESKQEVADELSRRAQSLVTEWIAHLEQPPVEIWHYALPDLPGAVIIKTSQGMLQLVWYDIARRQVVCH